jgi:hypothetical protein
MSDDPVSSAEQVEPGGDTTIQGSVSGTGIAIGHSKNVAIINPRSSTGGADCLPVVTA